MIGGGIDDELKQPIFSVGLKGVDAANADKVGCCVGWGWGVGGEGVGGLGIGVGDSSFAWLRRTTEERRLEGG